MTATALQARPRSLRPYVEIARLSARRTLLERGALLGRAGFYALILLIFSRLWAIVLERGAVPGVGAAEMIWYLALTEWVMLALPPLFLYVEADFRSGDVAYRLSRPLSYLGARLAEAAGEQATRLLVLGPIGALLALVLAGGWPDDARGLWLALPLGLLASALCLLFTAAIGLSAAWLQDCTPIYWIWQKAAFLLGGLLLPLEIYPDWLRTLAELTPFADMVHGVGSSAFGFEPLAALWTGLRLGLWLAAVGALAVWIYGRTLRSLDVNGG